QDRNEVRDQVDRAQRVSDDDPGEDLGDERGTGIADRKIERHGIPLEQPSLFPQRAGEGHGLIQCNKKPAGGGFFGFRSRGKESSKRSNAAAGKIPRAGGCRSLRRDDTSPATAAPAAPWKRSTVPTRRQARHASNTRSAAPSISSALRPA